MDGIKFRGILRKKGGGENSPLFCRIPSDATTKKSGLAQRCAGNAQRNAPAEVARTGQRRAKKDRRKRNRTTRGENRTNGKEEKYRKRDKNIVKICVCQEFCVSLSSDLDKKKDESKMDRVGG